MIRSAGGAAAADPARRGTQPRSGGDAGALAGRQSGHITSKIRKLKFYERPMNLRKLSQIKPN